MSVDWDAIAKAHWDEQPHPSGHGLKIKEFATAVKLATMAKFGGHSAPHEAALFWQEFAPGGVPIMAPEEFEHTLDKIAPLSFTYHGRPPTMKEIANLKDKQPHEARKYFADLPHKHLPHMTAGEAVKAMEAAKPHANEHLGRDPVYPELSHLHHSGTNPADYYAKLGEQAKQTSDTLPSNVTSVDFGSDSGRRGVASPGG
jgi:hypothetical protein